MLTAKFDKYKSFWHKNRKKPLCIVKSTDTIFIMWDINAKIYKGKYKKIVGIMDLG